MAEEETRSADYYVFCIYEEQDIQSDNILDLDKWLFVVVATEIINEVFGNQKSVSFNRLEPFGQSVRFSDLKRSIDSVLNMALF